MTLKRLHTIIEGGPRGSLGAHVFDAIIGLTILAAIADAIMMTDAGWAEANGGWSHMVENLAVVIFTAEYGLRVAVAVHDPRGRYGHKLWGRLKYMASPMALVDLAAILPTLLSFVVELPLSADQVLLLRCIRLFKLLRYFSAFDTLAMVIRNERAPLIAAVTLMAILLVMIATVGHILEKGSQPEAFGSVPRALWWGIVTLTTVGYGDVVPMTLLGRLFGGLAVVLGMGMFALPAGILATGFAEEMRRRNFTASWSLVARVPLFEHLSAFHIAEIVGLLEPLTAERGETIIHEGDPPDGMYFLIEGQARVLLSPAAVRLDAGAFFGEMGLIDQAPRSASVIAQRFCQLLWLKRAYFDNLMAQHEGLRASIEAVIKDRRAARVGPAPSQQPG
jgi:voltage-gated potassium channel